VARLREGLSICSEINLLPQWWAHRIALHLLSDLWASSFHERLPLLPAGGDAADWPSLRERFIASLICRTKAEIDLWPSQVAAAARAVDQADDLVVSLPTSAGKTRISELCILRCLAAGRRVVFVTPLRALSAQTEVTLQRTFGPLGKTISALYGSIGVSGFDEDAIRQRHIVVATPEKLDFALRNDPSLLDDVGLLVFDEGHMIGLSERKVRYEVQIQRLLRRADAAQRRIVCLSAILPEGDQLDDFAAWLRRDQESGLVRLLITLLVRMGKKVGGSLDQLVDYVVNNAEAWSFPEIAGEKPEDRERAASDWDDYLSTLDTAILSLIGENDIADEDIPSALDDVLQSSLWERRLNRRKDEVKAVLKAGLVSRSRQIWAQSTPAKRRGYFLAGIGLKTGHALDAMAAEGNDLLISANGPF
ncbi:MAG TPA: DEAD/DEAH box helicase, partial [Sphingomicrobium sp.]